MSTMIRRSTSRSGRVPRHHPGSTCCRPQRRPQLPAVIVAAATVSPRPASYRSSCRIQGPGAATGSDVVDVGVCSGVVITGASPGSRSRAAPPTMRSTTMAPGQNWDPATVLPPLPVGRLRPQPSGGFLALVQRLDQQIDIDGWHRRVHVLGNAGPKVIHRWSPLILLAGG